MLSVGRKRLAAIAAEFPNAINPTIYTFYFINIIIDYYTPYLL